MKIPFRRAVEFFLRPAVIMPIPGGIVPDRTAALALVGAMSNANAYSESVSSVATAGTNVTLLARNVVAGVVQLNTGASGAFTITLPATSAILDALGPAIPTDGTFYKPLFFINNGIGQTGTVTAGDAGTTVLGTATIADSTTRKMMMRVLNSTIQISNAGSLTL